MKTIITAILLLNSKPADRIEYIDKCEDAIEWLQQDSEGKRKPVYNIIINKLTYKVH